MVLPASRSGRIGGDGKVWQRDEKEPSAWTIEAADEVPNVQGSPGLFADAQFGVYFDNYKVTANQ